MKNIYALRSEYRVLKPFRSKIHPRGVSLIEALVAMAIMAFGMLAVIGVQATLRLNADIARQRTEATRLAEQHIEDLRSFEVAGTGTGTKRGFADIKNAAASVVTPSGANVEYTLKRDVIHIDGSKQVLVSVRVSWNDRYSGAQNIILRTVISGAAPVLSGMLRITNARTASTNISGRHPSIPSRAVNLPDNNKESGFAPKEGGTEAWTFDNATGEITRYCTVTVPGVSGASLSLTGTTNLNCNTVKSGKLLAGTFVFNARGATTDLSNGTSSYTPIRDGYIEWRIDNTSQKVVQTCNLSAGSPVCDPHAWQPEPGLEWPKISTFSATKSTLTAADSVAPQWPAIPIRLDITPTGTDPARCFTLAPLDSGSALRLYYVDYFCLVIPNTATVTNATPSGSWSGSPDIVGLQFSDGGAKKVEFSSTAGDYKVCRYTTATTDTENPKSTHYKPTANSDHPAEYTKVTGNLTNQNFLVIDGTQSCPTDGIIDVANGDLVNSNTLQYWPRP